MEKLLDKAKTGDKEAYENLVSEMYKYLYKIAQNRLDDEDDIKDAVQVALIKFDKKYMTIRESKALKKWARTVVKNICNDMYKSNKKITKLIEKLERNVELFESDLDKIEVNSKDTNLLDNLNSKEKEMILLRYVEEYSIKEICNELGENENTVKSNLHRAKQKLLNKTQHNRHMSTISIVILIIMLVSSGVTIGGRIINTLKEKITMFQITSSQAIDDAIANNYQTKIDVEEKESNGVGIKINEIAMDNKLLYISYLFDFGIDSEITDIELEKYSITDDKDNVLSIEIDRDVKNRFGSDYSSGGATFDSNPVRLDNGSVSYSTVFQVIYNKNYPLSNKLNINIEKISVTTENKRKYFDGNWNFEIDLPKEFANRIAENYTYKSNEKIKNIETTLNDLSFEIVVDFNDKINADILNSNDIILQNENGEIINHFSKIVNVHKNRVTYICDIGKYSKNIDKLNLYMKYNYGADQFIDVVLER